MPVVEGSFSMNNAELDLYEKSFESLVDIIQSAENRNIVVVGVIFPQNPDYKNTDAFGRYGMRRSVAEYYISRFEELERLYPNFKFLDENKMGSHDYSNELFVDDDHLCVNGSPVLTAKIDSFLKTLD